MYANPRDKQIVASFGQFRQLTSAHLDVMHFHDVTETPKYRAINRLLERHLIALVPWPGRMRGGVGGGSAYNVYQLGSMGRKLLGRSGRPMTAVNPHTLGIADAFCEILEYAHKGRIEIFEYRTEPNSWWDVNGVIVRPDLDVRYNDVWRREGGHVFIEYDRASEHDRIIRAKLDDYIAAYNSIDGDDENVPPFPLVVFVAEDAPRAKELQKLVDERSEHDRELFLVSTVTEFAPLLFS